MTELKYLLCRKFDFKKANQLVNDFTSNFIIRDERTIRDTAAQFKCKFPIALSDCYSLALAKMENAQIYMKKEREIEDIIKALLLEVQIKFIDDL